MQLRKKLRGADISLSFLFLYFICRQETITSDPPGMTAEDTGAGLLLHILRRFVQTRTAWPRVSVWLTKPWQGALFNRRWGCLFWPLPVSVALFSAVCEPPAAPSPRQQLPCSSLFCSGASCGGMLCLTCEQAPHGLLVAVVVNSGFRHPVWWLPTADAVEEAQMSSLSH